jgi:hypothetical protein
MGLGPARVSLMAGAHADEPVGPETLRTLVLGILAAPDAHRRLLDAFTFLVVPHVNPDGEERNRPWMEVWPNPAAYLRGAARELPGRDVEFSYPARRPENAAVSDWLSANGPFGLHMSLHGMGFSDGAMLLIERNWTYRTERLQERFTVAVQSAGLRLHDHNRKGEKGFFYVGPGFTTTPEGAAMRAYFRSRGDDETASLFGDSSMEFVRSLGGDPLCLVTELPLFLVDGPSEPQRPSAYLAFRDELPRLRASLEAGDGMGESTKRYGLRCVPVETAVALQMRALELGLETVDPG